MSTKSLTFFLLLCFVGNAFSATPNLNALSKTLKTNLRSARTFGDRYNLVVKFKSDLQSAAQEMAPQMVVADQDLAQHRISQKDFIKLNVEYYHFIELDGFLNLVPPFNGKKAKNCLQITTDISHATSLPNDLEQDPSRDIRALAKEIGQLLYSCRGL